MRSWGLGEVSKKAKIIKSGECEATFTLLIAFRGGCLVGCSGFEG